MHLNELSEHEKERHQKRQQKIDENIEVFKRDLERRIDLDERKKRADPLLKKYEKK